MSSDIMKAAHAFDQQTSGIMYFKHLIINPLKLEVTFTTRKMKDTTNITNTAANMILAMDSFIPSITNAPINLNALAMNHCFTSQNDMVFRITQHYRNQFTSQLYAILGSFEAIGNPVSFVQNMGTGVADLFYEPAKSITVSPKEFVLGLGRVSHLSSRETDQ